MKELPQVTLCAIDCVNPLLALRALDISMHECRFGEALFLSDTADCYQLPGCQMVNIPHIGSRSEYSRFVIKELGRYLSTSHMLLVQWDGYVINGRAWQDEFLNYDYIGAPWGFHKDTHRVGNGGFSLRSRRLFDALQDPRITELDPEDETIGRRYRTLLEENFGILFAREDLARSFSFETMIPNGTPFGFHGVSNMWMFLPKDQLSEFIGTLAPSSVKGPQLLILGRNYFELGRLEEAEIVLRRRLEVVPNDTEARDLLVKALARAPGGPVAGRASMGDEKSLLQSAIAHHQAGRLAEAEAGYRQVLGLNAGNAIAKQYLGVLLMQKGRPVKGELLIREAIIAMPAVPDFHNNLGLCLRQQGRLRESVLAYRQALAIKPDYAPALNNLGLDLQAIGEVRDAVGQFEQAVSVQRDFAEAHWNLGLALLCLGDFRRGWQEYEWRLKCQPFANDGLDLTGVAPWRGEPLEDKTLLVRREQGAGDTVQFLRFVPELRRRGARVVLHVSPDLIDLARSVAPDIDVVSSPENIDRVDYFVNLMSPPLWLGITIENLPAGVPYLSAGPERIAAWQDRLTAYEGRRIGLVWGGNPRHKNDHNRSCALALFEPLLALPGTHWFSLQKGEPAKQLAGPDGARIVDLGPELESYADTAAALAALDLVITVDTSIAHLAGATGRPAWVMIPFAPDWRWLLDRDDSPWYPTLRLFRQDDSAGWLGVRDRILQALEP